MRTPLKSSRYSSSTSRVAMSRSFVGSSSTRTFGLAARQASSCRRRLSPPLSLATSSCQRLAGKANLVSSCLATVSPTEAEGPRPPPPPETAPSPNSSTSLLASIQLPLLASTPNSTCDTTYSRTFSRLPVGCSPRWS
eukprot:32681-Prymnesium_polylepis.2